MYTYSLDDPVNLSDPTGECTFSQCVSRGLKVGFGVVKIGAGVIVVGASIGAEVGTGGLASVGAALGGIAGAGMVFSGALDIAAGISNNADVGRAASAVSNVTNPGGFVTTLVTYQMNGGDLDDAENVGSLGSLVFDGATSLSNFVSSLESGVDDGLGSVQAVTAPLTTALGGFVFSATGYLDNYLSPIPSPPSPTAPLPPTVDYSGGISQMPGNTYGITAYECQIYDIDNFCQTH
jgi:hypothetical protein